MLLPLAMALAARLRLLEMGDELAHALGARPGARGAATLIAVLAAAAAVSVAGPVAFVALAAPQIARLRARQRPLPLASALTGAALLAGADLLARHAGASGLPVGVLTAGIGGVYLAFLLLMEWKKTHDPARSARRLPRRPQAAPRCAARRDAGLWRPQGAGRPVADDPRRRLHRRRRPQRLRQSTLLRVLGGALAPGAAPCSTAPISPACAPRRSRGGWPTCRRIRRRPN